jgi:hypothetical protein
MSALLSGIVKQVRSCLYTVIPPTDRGVADFELLTPHIRGLSKKQHTTNESLKKIEDGPYGVGVPSQELMLILFRKPFMPLWCEVLNMAIRARP